MTYINAGAWRFFQAPAFDKFGSYVLLSNHFQDDVYNLVL